MQVHCGPDCLASRDSTEALHRRLSDDTPPNLINNTDAKLDVTCGANANLLLTPQRYPYIGLDSRIRLEFGGRSMSVAHQLVPQQLNMLAHQEKKIHQHWLRKEERTCDLTN